MYLSRPEFVPVLDPSIIDALVASGVSVQQLAAAVKADAIIDKEKFLEQRYKATIRKRNQRARHRDSMGQSVTLPLSPLPPCPPSDKEKVSIPLKEINSSLNPPSPLLPTSLNIIGELHRDFDIFWSNYPRKDSRQNALKAYLKARKKGASSEEILAGLDRYKSANGPDFGFYAHGSTWLNGQRWEDENQPRKVQNGQGQGNILPAARRLIENIRRFEAGSSDFTLRSGTGHPHVRLLPER